MGSFDSVYSLSPPEPRSRLENHPTLLFSWWTTLFSFVIILFRLSGRYIRNECLFREDKIMAWSIIPLLARMAFVHAILLYGTNNVVTIGLTEHQIYERSIGSRLVLASRFFYALFIWTAKFTVSEFLKRLTSTMWRKSYDTGLKFIRIFLFATFLATVIADLAECHPFTHYWQVVPDPGPKCRQGFAQLLTMGIADILTDILLIVFPIPIILRSGQPFKRKVSLVLLFGLSFILIVITAYRMPAVIRHQGRQQYRTVWASSEILAAAAVSNALVLGSFIRDRGLKKPKYKFGSFTDSMDRTSTRRPTMSNVPRDSDEHLFHGHGFRFNDDSNERLSVPRPAPIALPAARPGAGFDSNWSFPKSDIEYDDSSENGDLKSRQDDPAPSPGEVTISSPRRNVSFFDVGGLLENGPGSTRAPLTTTTSVQDFANSHQRRGSRALLSDLGGLLTPARTMRRPSKTLIIPESHEMMPQNATRSPDATSSGSAGPLLNNDAYSLQDVGGLLSNERFSHDTAPTSELNTPTTPAPAPYSITN
ncbi:MAG: hypothetical protein M1822_004349 [Bathelium mastoideum]|nr:MAG: hypothetical protein M1822_004349 [Bathelium mastoideum]